MTPRDEQWIKDAIVMMGRQNLERRAQIKVLTEVIAGILSNANGVEVSSALAGLKSKMTAEIEASLLRVEDVFPALAAQMDKDRPLVEPIPPQKP